MVSAPLPLSDYFISLPYYAQRVIRLGDFSISDQQEPASLRIASSSSRSIIPFAHPGRRFYSAKCVDGGIMIKRSIPLGMILLLVSLLTILRSGKFPDRRKGEPSGFMPPPSAMSGRKRSARCGKPWTITAPSASTISIVFIPLMEDHKKGWDFLQGSGGRSARPFDQDSSDFHARRSCRLARERLCASTPNGWSAG